MKEEKELSLEELDDIKAGYPNADKINLLAKKFKPTEKSKDKAIYPDYIKENKKLIDELPQGELKEKDLDNVLAGINK